MQVISQYRVDAPVAWVRSFLLAGTNEDDVTVDGDLVEVRQHDKFIHLVVRNTLSDPGDGGTQLDVDAQLRLLGLARIVGGLFAGRVWRTLVRSLDRLPVAIEQALERQQSDAASPDEEADGTPAAAGDGVIDSVKRVGRALDRTFSGEYEAREDEAAADRAEGGTDQ